MAFAGLALPVLPNKMEVWREYNNAVNGPRKAEFEDMMRRHGVMKQLVWRQQTPQGNLLIVFQETEGAQPAIRTIAASSHPFDQWFIEQVKDFSGVDLSAPPASPPELVLEYVADGGV